jgi:hypothetical protein
MVYTQVYTMVYMMVYTLGGGGRHACPHPVNGPFTLRVPYGDSELFRDFSAAPLRSGARVTGLVRAFRGR